ncbi:hypothetical protein [Solirhodobacter olei]|uniref:hypothetical protein n=1 Tax=Solirhodobacter olei TaxID=2493082 RepID=UPI0019D4207B|nr:hypothetical protein [Solirhodobacter olei]
MTKPQNPPRRMGRTALLAAAIASVGVSPLVAALPAQAEKAVAPERNPPGDIPDTQVFITYHSAAGGYSLKVPEGWARREAGADVQFAAKLDAVAVNVEPTATAPTVAWVKSAYVPAMIKAGRAVKVSAVSAVHLPGGNAVRIAYAVNSEPNPVTSKQVRLEANRYLFFKGGKRAALDLTAPYGSDNVDQWRLMSRSFRWR